MMPCPLASLLFRITLLSLLLMTAFARDSAAEIDDGGDAERGRATGAGGPPGAWPAAPRDGGRPFAAGDRAPPVDALCKAAVDLALADPERARGFVSRARLAGWLPEVTFRVYRRFARTEGLSFADVGAGIVEPVDISAIDDVRYEWRASWDLSRMVFNPDELQAHFEALRMADVRREIQSLVILLYFERRRLVLETQAARPMSTSDLAAPERRLARIGELEAQLDVLSDGAFSAGAATSREASHAP